MKKPKFDIRFYKNYKFVWIPNLFRQKLRWKDKFETPRCERVPHFLFEWLWFAVYGEWGDDHYWEQWLWVYKYCDGDIEKAEKEWGWTDYDTKESTWINY